MAITRLAPSFLKKLIPWSAAPAASSQGGLSTRQGVDHGWLSSTAQILAAVRREKERADRYENPFCVAVLPTACGRHPAVNEIAGRIRASDVAGINEQGVPALLLPETKRSGAQHMLSSLEFVEPDLRQNARVYEYPQDLLIVTEVERLLTPHSPPPDPPGGAPASKRAFDIAVSLIALLVTSPITLGIAAYIALVSKGPILLRQVRIGAGGKPFEMLKFRTMEASERPTDRHKEHSVAFIKDGTTSMEKVDSDLPIIPGGRLIRRLGLDELPQALNVLKGDMSLVGPRPCMPYEAAAYRPWHRQRFEATPGITGLWQVSGKNRLTFQEMVRLDIRYIRTWSFLSDLAIVAKTPFTVLDLAIHGESPKRVTTRGHPRAQPSRR